MSRGAFWRGEDLWSLRFSQHEVALVSLGPGSSWGVRVRYRYNAHSGPTPFHGRKDGVYELNPVMTQSTMVHELADGLCSYHWIAVLSSQFTPANGNRSGNIPHSIGICGMAERNAADQLHIVAICGNPQARDCDRVLASRRKRTRFGSTTLS
jgi:hypothetical protein